MLSTPASRLQSARFGPTLAVLVPLLALLPLARLGYDWVQVSQVLQRPALSVAERGYDWVQWEERDGRVVARYVFPRSPAEDGGLRAGDVFVSIEGQMIFGADELKRVISGLPPGTRVLYEITRGDEMLVAEVPLTRYPTFLYPLNPALWLFSLWGFLVGAILHMPGLAIALPLARTSLRAWHSLRLILVSSLWMFSNLARLLMVEFFGPATVPGAPYDTMLQILTALGLVGWLLFPALLLKEVLVLSGASRVRSFRRTRWLRFAPPVVLGALALLTVAWGSLGPVSLDTLVGPMLFYAACYIAGAAALSLVLGDGRARRLEQRGGWNRWGSLATLLTATVVGLALLGLLPMLSRVEDATLGWLVVLTQLLSVAPIVLVTLSTLRYGKVDTVVSSALANGLVAACVFIAFAGTMYALGPILRRTEAPTYLIGAVLCVVLLFGAEAVLRRLSDTPFFLSTEQQRVRKALRAYARGLNAQVDADALAGLTVETAGETVHASSAVLFYRLPSEQAWRSASYHPNPPRLTAEAVARLWPVLESQQELWARDDEVSDIRLPADVERELRAVGAAVVLPIRGDSEPIGLLALADRRGRRRVFNLEDLDFLRILCGQFGLAVERLALIERERLLARAHAEARLVALRTQINPHFLFNALNTIAALVAEQPDEAEQVVEHLSSIFRHTLRTAEATFVPLGDEMDLVGHYLAIEKARFGDKLEAYIEVPAELHTLPVPPFVVQTLVENSVKHGLAPRRGGGFVRIMAQQTPEEVTITVEDDGVGIAGADDPGDEHYFGIGLQNVAGRLRYLYRDARLRIERRPGAGTRATIRLPVHEMQAARPLS